MYVSDRRQNPRQSGRTLKHHFSEDSWMEMFWFRQSIYAPQANTWTCPRLRSPTGTASSPQGASLRIATVSATPTHWTGRDRLCSRLYWNTIVYTCMIVHFFVNRHSLIILVECINIILYFSPSHRSLSLYAIITFATTNIHMYDWVLFLSFFPYDSNAKFMLSKHWKDFSIGECVQNFWHAWNTPSLKLFFFFFYVFFLSFNHFFTANINVEQVQGFLYFYWWWPSSAQTLEHHFWLWLHPSQMSGVSHQH